MKWALRDIPIKLRLRLFFGVLVLLMLAGAVLSLYQFHNVGGHIASVTRSEQRMAALLRLNSSTVTMMSQLSRAAALEDAIHFEREAQRLLQSFQPRITEANSQLREIRKESDRHALLVDSIQSVIDALPNRIASFVQLAQANDWIALHARLRNQADTTDDVFAAIMEQADNDLSEDRRRLADDAARAQRRGITLLAFAGLLGLTAAIFLGSLVTRSITRPLSDLDAGARALAAGRFEDRVPESGQDELSRLGAVFNQSAAELSRLFEEVRKQHAEAEAAQSELRQQAEELRRANADLQQFAYSASHDLREPLRTLAVYSQLLRREYSGRLEADAEEYLEYIHQSARRMEQLVQDVLTYTQTSAAVAPTEASTDAGAVLTQVLTILEPDIRAAGCEVTAGDLPRLQMHEVHVQQLLQNLIVNAVRYRSERAPQISVSAEPQENYWLFSVRDNGIGIDPKYFKHIFGIFKRLHGPTYPGTGIGLAICQRIVEGYGGRIWVESAPGEGATFRFTLPRLDGRG